MSAANVTASNWWALVLGGVATLIFGVASVFWPGLSLLTLLYLFAAWALVSGIVNVMASLSAGAADTWFLPVVLGAFQTGVGVYLLRHTDVKFSTLILLIGFTLIATGIIDAVVAFFNAAITARAQAMNYLSALAALAAGIVILFADESKGVAFVWLLGLYAIVVGTLQISALGNSTARR